MSIFDRHQQDQKVMEKKYRISDTNYNERFKEDKVLEILKNVVEGSTIQEDKLYIADMDLSIETHVPYVNGAVAQLVFILKHKMFEEEIVEAVAGAGHTFDEAIYQGVEAFVNSVLVTVRKVLNGESDRVFEVKLPNRTNTFKAYIGDKTIQGTKASGDNIDYWALLGEDILRCIGNKKIYTIKVYAAKTAKGINCECSVNGIVYSNITKALGNVANRWEIEGAIYSEKQVFILVQEETTYVPFKISRKEVESQTLNALLLYRECESQETYEKLYEEISKACGDVTLATELYNFIPEIFTEIIFSDAYYSDEMMLVRGEERIHLYRRQLTTYDWIYSVVERTIRAGYFEKKQVDQIIKWSTSFNSIREAVGKGSKVKDLSMMGIGVVVPLEYEII